MTLGLLKGIQALQPHGVGNRRPLFMAGGLQLVGAPRKVGGGERHLQFKVRQGGGPIFKAIAFGMAEREPELLSANGQCCLVFTPNRNEWQGMVSVDLEIIDFQPGAAARVG
jgi:single-stranded-DNA-specific exonuclease